PCNTNCLIAMHHAPHIPRSRFHAMTRLDQNRAQFQLAEKGGIDLEEVTNVTIWGNHSSTQVPDFVNALIQKKPVLERISDAHWLETTFFEKVQKRGAEVIAARGKSSAASAAHAIIEGIKSLYVKTAKGHWFSNALLSDHNSYGIEKELIFSFPCLSKGEGDVHIVSKLKWTPFLENKIRQTERELIEERDMVQELLT
ncbi:MAG: malate dehydrogenase, partial [Simkania negevensis]|nr:malate dehydrogenase [Simkania negevensis]